MIPSPALSCQPCLIYVDGWHTPQPEGSQAGHGSQPITPPAAIHGRNGMAAISCAFGRYGQVVASPVRAGQGATFHPHSSKAPMGFSPFQDTAGGSQYPPAVPPSRAVARPGTPPSERRGGVFSEQSPDGVFTFRAGATAPLKEVATLSGACGRCAALPLPRRFLKLRGAWQAGELRRSLRRGGVRSTRCTQRPAMRRGVPVHPAWIETSTLRYLFTRSGKEDTPIEHRQRDNK